MKTRRFKPLIPITVGLFLSIFFTPARADEFSRWTWRVPNPPSIYWQKVIFANGQFVAVGDVGSIMTSTNGKDWFVENSVVTNRLFNVIYGERYVATGDHGTITSSVDVHQWELSDFPTNSWILATAYGNKVYSLLDTSGNDFVSTNALHWTEVQPPPPTGGADMAFGGGQFVVVGASGLIMTSTNGESWIQRDSGTTGSFLAIAYGDGKFVAVGSENDGAGSANGFIEFSYNGIDWFYQSIDTSTLPKDITFADGQFVIVGGGGIDGPAFSLNSSDGIYFNSASGDNGLGSSEVNGVACGNGVCGRGKRRVQFERRRADLDKHQFRPAGDHLSVCGKRRHGGGGGIGWSGGNDHQRFNMGESDAAGQHRLVFGMCRQRSLRGGGPGWRLGKLARWVQLDNHHQCHARGRLGCSLWGGQVRRVGLGSPNQLRVLGDIH